MKTTTLVMVLTFLFSSALLAAETPSAGSSSVTDQTYSGGNLSRSVLISGRSSSELHPFGFGAGTASVSSLGGQFQIETTLTPRFDLRSQFSGLYWKKWITYGGFTAPANVNLLSQSSFVDIYLMRGRGFRLSPGFLMHTPAIARANVQLGPMANGTFTLNNHTYYSVLTPNPNPSPFSPAPGPEPPSVIEEIRLRKAAFAVTTGWSNAFARGRASNWAFPIDFGVAFLGSPSLKQTGIQGQVCDLDFTNCTDAATNPQFRTDLQAHFAPYVDRLSFLKIYPFISFGVTRRFDLHPWEARRH